MLFSTILIIYMVGVGLLVWGDLFYMLIVDKNTKIIETTDFNTLEKLLSLIFTFGVSITLTILLPLYSLYSNFDKITRGI